MGNVASFDTNGSVCCIPLEDVSDDNTIKNVSSRKDSMNLFTREEKSALQSLKTAPGSIGINKEHSFSSLSSKSSSKSNHAETNCRRIARKKANGREGYFHHEMDEMRNDYTESCKSIGDEERVGASNEENVESYYYSSPSRHSRENLRRNSIFNDERME